MELRAILNFKKFKVALIIDFPQSFKLWRKLYVKMLHNKNGDNPA